MTLRADLTALLADVEIDDVDIEEAVEDEHMRLSTYLRIIAQAAASKYRDNDYALVEMILRDPIPGVAKAAVVELVDSIAMKMTDPVDFQQWAAGLMPKIVLLEAEGNRRFVRQRIHDWTVCLAIKSGQIPSSAELADTTPWMQRRIAEKSTSLTILNVLTETGRTRKIQNIARNRSGSRAVRMNTDSTS